MTSLDWIFCITSPGENNNVHFLWILRFVHVLSSVTTTFSVIWTLSWSMPNTDFVVFETILCLSGSMFDSSTFPKLWTLLNLQVKAQADFGLKYPGTEFLAVFMKLRNSHWSTFQQTAAGHKWLYFTVGIKCFYLLSSVPLWPNMLMVFMTRLFNVWPQHRMPFGEF